MSCNLNNVYFIVSIFFKSFLWDRDWKKVKEKGFIVLILRLSILNKFTIKAVVKVYVF